MIGVGESRSDLDKYLDHLQFGGEVVVWKVDWLKRNSRNLLGLINDVGLLLVPSHAAPPQDFAYARQRRGTRQQIWKGMTICEAV